MRTGHDRGVADLAIMKQGRKIVGLVVGFLCGWRAPVSTPVVANGVKPFAEGRPDLIPNSGVHDAVVEEDHGLRTTPAFLVIKARPIDLDEGPTRRDGARSLCGRDPSSEEKHEKERGSQAFHVDKIIRSRDGTQARATTKPEFLNIQGRWSA